MLQLCRRYPSLDSSWATCIARIGLNANVQYALVLDKRYLTLGNLFLLVTQSGGRRFWELVLVGGGVVQPRPDPADAPQEEIVEVQGCLQQEPKVEQKDKVVDPDKRSASN